MWQHTVLCPTDSLPTHPDSLHIELIYLLYSMCWGEDLSWELPLLKKFFHVMSNVESLDNQTFLSYLVYSFINVFQLQDFHLFLYFCFISQKNTVGGFRHLGPGGDSRESFGRGNL